MNGAMHMVGKNPDQREPISRYDLSLADVYRFINLNNAEAIFQRLRSNMKVSTILTYPEYYIPEWKITFRQLVDISQQLKLKKRPKVFGEENAASQQVKIFSGIEIFIGWFNDHFSIQDTFFVDGDDLRTAAHLLKLYREVNTITHPDSIPAPLNQEKEHFEVGHVYQILQGDTNHGSWFSEADALQEIQRLIKTYNISQPDKLLVQQRTVLSYDPEAKTHYTPESHLSRHIDDAVGEVYEAFIGDRHLGYWRSREEALDCVFNHSPIARPASDMPTHYQPLTEREYYIQPRTVFYFNASKGNQ